LKIKKLWTDLKFKIVEETGGHRFHYIPYKDSEGNRLEPSDIYFTDIENYHGKQTVDLWDETTEGTEYVTVESDDVKYIYDEEVGNFPVALEYKGKMLYLKISKKSGEVLPIHAGCCPSFDILMTGGPGSGKTVFVIQCTDEAFQDLLVRDNPGFSFQNDLPVESPFMKRYEQIRRDLKMEKKLPDPTRRGEILLPYVFYVSYEEHGTVRRMLLNIQDIDGQFFDNMPWTDQRLNSCNHIFFTVPADELLAAERGEPVMYNKILDQLIPRFRMMRRNRDYHMTVIITKADLLKAKDYPALGKILVNNSVAAENGAVKRVLHKNGVDLDALAERNNCVQEYLEQVSPRFLANVRSLLPKQNLNFCLVASIGEECHGNYREMNPINIDEPFLSLLAREGMYPVKERTSLPPITEEAVNGIPVYQWKERIKKYVR